MADLRDAFIRQEFLQELVEGVFVHVGACQMRHRNHDAGVLLN